MSEDVIQKARQHAAVASLASLDGDLNIALSELILATECYAEGIRATESKQDRKLLLSLFDECADEAERIKERQLAMAEHSDRRSAGEDLCQADCRVTDASRSASVVVRQPMRVINFSPAESRTMTRKEQMLLLKASKVGQRVYPLWNADHIKSHLQLTEPFTDETKVFGESTEHIHGVVRIPDCVSEAQLTNDDMVIHTTVSQAVLNDCSLVASLIVASQWSTRFRTRLLTSALFPQNDLGEPILSVHGKYMLKVQLNGAFRQVVVDDFLPVDSAGSAQKILAFSSNYPTVCWPALVHKAFRKVRGPEFQGSNSASDLWLLTGWIPEQITLRGHAHDMEVLWDRLYKAWVQGNVLITLGTGKLSEEERQDSGLVSEHNYAVTQLQLEEREKVVTIQNPWRALGQEDSLRVPSTPEYKTIFDMEFSQVSIHFATLFLNWNPTLWKHQVTTHFNVSQTQFSMTDNNVSQCPQFVMTNAAERAVEVCLLLSSHYLSPDSDSSPSATAVYSSLGIYDTNGTQVLWPSNPILRTDYHGSLELTVHVSIPAKKSYTLVVTQRNARTTQSMTLVAYHDEPKQVISLTEPRVHWTHHRIEYGHWTNNTAGGNPTLKSYAMNPQYTLRCETATTLHAILECDVQVNVNMDIVYGQSRPLKLTRRDVAASGKEYRQTYQVLRCVLQPGQYTLVVSTYKPNKLGRFKVSIFSDDSIELRHVKALGAGQSKKVMCSHWSTVNRRQRFEILVDRMSTVTLHVHPSNPVRHSLKVSQDDTFVAGTEGRGSLGLEKVPMQKRGRWKVECELMEEYRGDLDFEVQLFSDSVVQLQRC